MLQAFYNTLFEVEISALGIFLAAIFVFLQILHTSSYRDMLFFVRQRYTLIYGSITFFTILITGIGTLHFALKAHDFIPAINFGVKTFFANNFTTAGLLFSFLLSLTIGIHTIYKSTKFLNPSLLIRRYLIRIDNDSIRSFLYKHYGVPTPFPPIRIIFSSEDKKQTVSEQEKELADAQKKYEIEKDESEQLKIAVQDAPDVFEGFESLLIKAVSHSDTETIESGTTDFISKIKLVINDADEQFPLNHLAQYVRDCIQRLLGACRRYNMQSFGPQFIKKTREIALLLIERDGHATEEIIKGWKIQANICIKNSEQDIFREIINNYQEVADIEFAKNKKGSETHLLDVCFQHLGWISERLLAEKGMEDRPLMHDDDYNDEFGDIFNALLSFESKYNNNPDRHPGMYFDAIYVLFNQLLEVYFKSPERISIDIRNWLFSCAYVYSSFAEAALKVGNADGVIVAAIDLKKIYEKATDKGAKELAKTLIGLLVRLAIITASNPEKMEKGTLLFGETVPSLMEKIILISPHHSEIKKEVSESVIKFDQIGDRAKKWDYIKSLGKKMRTNFGLMFDWVTGADIKA